MEKFSVLLCLVSLFVGSEASSSSHCLFLDLKVEREGKHGDFKYSEMQDENPATVESDSINHIASELSRQGQAVVNGVAHCSSDLSSCFSMWKYDHVNGTRRPLKQGCWNNPDEQRACDAVTPEAPCVGHPIVNNSTFFCCCRGDLCNANMTEGTFKLSSDFLDTRDDSSDMIASDYRTQTITIALSSVSTLAVVIIIAFLVYRLRCMPRDVPNDPFYLGEPPSTPLFIMDDLHSTDLIARGRFGTVWKGELNSVAVAIKVFTPSQRLYFTNEQDILQLPHMLHLALPKFYGAGERITVDGSPEYVIVMEYIESGSLTDYLRGHTLDWTKLCRMMHSAAAGLAHLHADFTKADKSKPAIAHRDFNSRNIMVKSDLSCCLVDFGFATRIDGCHFYRNGQEENAEQTSLSDVGTIRYMSPEVLEGAVNLRDCEASLKQIDVYALGLVLWEMSMRCTDLFQGLATPEYQLPFHAELGLHPSFEQMQVWVSRNKQRPPFPDIWKDTNQAIRALKETIEDCWDQDAEARLTAMCVEERALDMTLLWETRHKGLTPTIASLGDLEEKGIMERNLTSVVPPPPMTPPLLPEANQRNDLERRPLESSLSTSTVETMILSPDDNGLPIQHRNLIYGRPPQVMKPQHQGQNPTVARNTHKHSDEELSVQGNCLVLRGATPSNVTSDDLISAFADTWENSLLPNELTRPVEAVRPKQPNVPKFNFKRKNGFMSLFKRHKGGAEQQREQLMSNYSDEVGKSNLAPRGTEVCIVNGAPIVRPTSLNVEPPNVANGLLLPRSSSHENVTALKTPVGTETPAVGTEDWRLESQQRNLFHPETSSSNSSFAL